MIYDACGYLQQSLYFLPWQDGLNTVPRTWDEKA